MKLRVFRSLVSSQRCPASLAKQLRAQQVFDGCEISLAQLQAAPSLLHACSKNDMRVLVRLEPRDELDAEVQLEQLGSMLSNSGHEADVLELVNIIAPDHMPLQDTLDYLRHLQPLWSTFLELHPYIGSRHGKLNAHGNPLNAHVLGINHCLSGGVPSLAECLDIYTPTRLALRSSNLVGAPNDSTTGASSASALPVDVSEGLSEELESIVAASDLLYASPDDLTRMAGILPWWDEVWSAQQLDGAAEVYVACCPEAGALAGGLADDNATDEAIQLLARRLRERFQASTTWRDGARERRKAEAEVARKATARRASLGPSGALEAAAASFGLSMHDLDVLNAAQIVETVKERWRQLALTAHPDVPGGSAERFLELRDSYRMLLRVAKSRANGL